MPGSVAQVRLRRDGIAPVREGLLIPGMPPERLLLVPWSVTDVVHAAALDAQLAADGGGVLGQRERGKVHRLALRGRLHDLDPGRGTPRRHHR